MVDVRSPSPDWPTVETRWWGRTSSGAPVEGEWMLEPLWGVAVDDDPAWPVVICPTPVRGELGTVMIPGDPNPYGGFTQVIAASIMTATGDIIGGRAPWRLTITARNGASPDPLTFWADPTANPILLPRYQQTRTVTPEVPVPIPTGMDLVTIRQQIAVVANQTATMLTPGPAGTLSQVFDDAMKGGTAGGF